MKHFLTSRQIRSCNRPLLYRPEKPHGFTLIELLIVVAIIAILAAIAVPNFLEAQVRAKVSRVRADLRTVATGLEMYVVDYNSYPFNDGIFNVLPIQLTSPVAYLANVRFRDPFTNKKIDPVFGNLVQFYTYHKIVTLPQAQADALLGYPAQLEMLDQPGIHEPLRLFGKWRLLSFGPDLKYSDSTQFSGTDPIFLGDNILYDSTNGTISWGNIQRTQKSPTGESQP